MTTHRTTPLPGRAALFRFGRGFHGARAARGEDDPLEAAGGPGVPCTFATPCLPDPAAPAACRPHRSYASEARARKASSAAAIAVDEPAPAA